MRMNFNSIKNVILDTKTLVPTAFIVAGAFKIHADYKNAKPTKKLPVLYKDTTILSGSAGASLGMYYLLKKIPNYEFINHSVKFLSKGINKINEINFVKNKIKPALSFLYKPARVTGTAVKYSLNTLERAIKDCATTSLITLAAFGGAIAANWAFSKIIFKKPQIQPQKQKSAFTSEKKQQTEEIEKKRVARYTQYVDESIAKDSANNAFSAFIKDMPALKMLDKPLVALAGFDIIKEKTFEDRFKRTTHELIANTLIPTFFISIASVITKSMKNFAKLPIISIAAITGVYSGKKIGEKVKNKFPEHLDYNEMLKNWHALKLW